MGFLTGIEIRRRIADGSIQVRAVDPRDPFSIDNQVTEDSIDLRLAPAAMILKSGVDTIDYVHDQVDSMYEVVQIPAEGYSLEPNEVLLSQSLEVVCFPDDLMGLVVTRNSFARLGLMVTCMAPKSPPGIRWALPLQLINISKTTLRIYPFTSIAQLLISTTVGEPVGYRGKFQDCYSVTPPLFSDRERASIGALNPEATLRTFHIIERDALSRQEGSGSGGADDADVESPGPDRSTQLLQRRGFRTAAALSLSTLAAIGFGIAGNLVAAGSIDYWQGVSIILLLLLSAICAGGALLVERSKRSQ